MSRCGPPEVVAVSLVSEWKRFEIVPVSPRWLNATDVNATSVTRHANPAAVSPTRLRILGEGASRLTRKPMISPIASSTAVIVSSSIPNSPAALSRTLSGTRSFVNASRCNAHTITGAAPTTETPTTARLRTRSGTNANHTMSATTAAPSAPRE